MTTVFAHLKLETHINDEIICMSECVPDSVKNRIYITSAYKKGSTDQLLNMDSNESPQLTSKTSFGDDATIDSISDLFDFVKRYDAEEKAPIWFTASRLQLPHAVQTIISANSIIPDSSEKSNSFSEKVKKIFVYTKSKKTVANGVKKRAVAVEYKKRRFTAS